VRVSELRSSTTLETKRCAGHREGEMRLDNAFALIEGHPQDFPDARRGWATPLSREEVSLDIAFTLVEGYPPNNPMTYSGHESFARRVRTETGGGTTLNGSTSSEQASLRDRRSMTSKENCDGYLEPSP
jgi:hypothetical protein